MRPRAAAAGDSDAAPLVLTFVPSFRQSEHSVVDQRELLVLSDENPINEGAIVAVVLHKHLAALLTHTQTHTHRTFRLPKIISNYSE